MLRRVACIFLPELRLELAKRAVSLEERTSDGGQLRDAIAVIMARRGGAVQRERDILGNTRIDAASPEAWALGIRAGQTVAAARAKIASLRVRVVSEENVQAELACVAEAALTFGPAAGFDAAQDVVWVDVGGCAHLRGGELGLAQALEASVRELGHRCRVAVSDGPRVAAAVARFGRTQRRQTLKWPVVVPPEKGAAAMRPLPVAALGLDAEGTAWLCDLGLRTCGDLQRLPRRSLGTRLGARALDVMQLLDGDDRAPLVAWRPPEVPEEKVSLEWGVSSVDALAFVLKALCDRLAPRLERRGMAAVRLEIVLSLDAALCHSGQEHVTSLHVILPSAMHRAGEWLAVLRARIESLENSALAAPVLAVTLRAPELAHHVPRSLDLLVPEPKALRALPRLVAELVAELGPGSVGTLGLVDTWVPQERTRLEPFGTVQEGRTRRSLVTSALEPTRLVEPSRMPRDSLAHVRVLARVEEVGWWRNQDNRQTLGRTPEGVARHEVVDMASAWVGSKHEGALAWVELREEEALLRGWID